MLFLAWFRLLSLVCSKERLGKFILALGQHSMKCTLFSTGSYMDMLMDGLCVSIEQQDG